MVNRFLSGLVVVFVLGASTANAQSQSAHKDATVIPEWTGPCSR